MDFLIFFESADLVGERNHWKKGLKTHSARSWETSRVRNDATDDARARATRENPGEKFTRVRFLRNRLRDLENQDLSDVYGLF